MEIPTYKELLKLMWFLVWRHVVILMFVSMTIGWAVPVILNNTVSEDSQYLLEICIYGVLFFGITPFILKTLFQKQFQGFQGHLSTRNEDSSSPPPRHKNRSFGPLRLSMKIATWNVNSIKVRIPHLMEWVAQAEPDVVLLQELKTTEDQFPRMAIDELGYNMAVVGQKTYNGVAILSKMPIEVEQTALPGDPSDEQARYVEALIGNVRIASIYLPNGNPVGTEKFLTNSNGWID